MNAEFIGDFFDGRSSRRHRVRVHVHDGNLEVRGDDVAFDVPGSQADVRPRLGTTPMRIGLPDGGLIVARDFAAVDAGLGVPRSRTLAHRLESHVAVVLLALAALALGGWFAYRDGIPWLSDRIAQRIPPALEAELSRDALASADAIVFKPSRLTPEREAAVRREFAGLLARADVPAGTRLEFRDAGYLGANALTFPGGLIVVTDKLANVLGDKEVAAVLAHELGHVHHRHGLRTLLNHSMHALFAMAVFGDVSAVSGVAATVPTVLINSGYSRGFERQADDFAFDLLRREGRSPLDFAAAMRALQGLAGQAKGAPAPRFGYLSTHPDTEERIIAAEAAARR